MGRFFGRCRIAVSGKNIDGLADKLRLVTEVFKIKRVSDEKIIFTADYKNTENIFAFIDKTCYNIEVLAVSGFLPLIAFLKRRWSLVVGFALFLAAAVTVSLSVLRVDVVSDGEYDTAAVEDELRSSGLITPFKFGISCDEIEKHIYLNFEDVSFVSCRLRGTGVLVEIVPSLTYDADAVRDEVTAECGGIVEKIIVRSGTPLVKKGDVVNVGDTLIVGEIDGVKVPALGEVYVTVTVAASRAVDTVRTVVTRTGSYTDVRTMDFLFFDVTVNNPEITYTTYETESFWSYPFEGCLLPFKINTVRYYETSASTEAVDTEAAKLAAYRLASADLLAPFGADCDVLGEEVETAEIDGRLHVNVIMRILARCGGS